jgi:hypothetical protein
VSAYHTVKTVYKDPECLVAALGEQGYTTVEQHDIAQSLYGYRGDKREQTANIIVRRCYVGGAANDIGYKRLEDGTYEQIISDFDKGKHNVSWLNKLKKHYTEKVCLKTAKKSGLTYLGKKVVNGRVQLQWLDNRS